MCSTIKKCSGSQKRFFGDVRKRWWHGGRSGHVLKTGCPHEEPHHDFKNPAPAVLPGSVRGLAMINKRGQKPGTQRGNRQRFPYEPRVIGGKLLMPAELQLIHRYVVETPVLEAVTDEIRAVVETVWPELISKLPPKL
jgi:hypothetical protein